MNDSLKNSMRLRTVFNKLRFLDYMKKFAFNLKIEDPKPQLASKSELAALEELFLKYGVEIDFDTESTDGVTVSLREIEGSGVSGIRICEKYDFLHISKCIINTFIDAVNTWEEFKDDPQVTRFKVNTDHVLKDYKGCYRYQIGNDCRIHAEFIPDMFIEEVPRWILHNRNVVGVDLDGGRVESLIFEYNF